MVLTTILKFSEKSTSVSGTLDAINVDGVGNELNSQVALRATEMKN